MAAVRAGRDDRETARQCLVGRIRERIEMIDGKLVIESAPGKGTTIMVEVNYDNTITGRR